MNGQNTEQCPLLVFIKTGGTGQHQLALASIVQSHYGDTVRHCLFQCLADAIKNLADWAPDRYQLKNLTLKPEDQIQLCVAGCLLTALVRNECWHESLLSSIK